MSSPSETSESPHSVQLNKRKANGPPAESQVKRRAARACLRCRNRKVRCDVTSSGVPCNNCRLDAEDCLLVETNRGKPQSSSNWTDPRPTLVNEKDAEDFPVSLTFDGPRGLVGSRENTILGQNGDEAVIASLPSPITTTTRLSFPPNDKQAPLPSYIRPLPPHIEPEDVAYLARKGALTLPDEQLQCALLRSYLQYVHNFMPVLDLAPVYTAIAQRGDGVDPVSLILVQAIMFAGVAYVDLDQLTSRGFQSRKAARTIFFNRVRLLYGLECETDRMSLLQALILMTYWYENPDDEKETWYYLGIALSLAQILGLHRDPTCLDISPAKRSSRKRIWWCCFMRDRLLAIGLRRPIRLRQEDFNVPLLTMNDYELAPFNDDVVRWLGPLPLMDDTEEKNKMMMASMELSKLCMRIGDILSTQYSLIDSTRMTNVMVVPKKSPEATQDLARCNTALEEWMQDLHSSCLYQPGKMPNADKHPDTLRVTSLHLALLHMVYYTAMNVLHRPQAFQPGQDHSDTSAMRLSREKVTEAAVRITDIIDDLCRQDLLRFASTSSITAILSATVTHLFHIRSDNHDMRSISIGRFYQCWHALQQLRDMYAAADHAVWFLEGVIQGANVKIPMLKLTIQPSANQRSRVVTALDTTAAPTLSPAQPDSDVIVVGSLPRVHQPGLTINGPNSAPLPSGMTLPPNTGTAYPPHTSVRFDLSQDENCEPTNSFEMGDDIMQTLMQFDTSKAPLPTDDNGTIFRWDI